MIHQTNCNHCGGILYVDSGQGEVALKCRNCGRIMGNLAKKVEPPPLGYRQSPGGRHLRKSKGGG